MGWVTEHHPLDAELNACVQCGLCLPVCPTFRLTGRETASPRGRLHAMSGVAQGIVDVDETFAGILDFCLGCRACEPVCPGLVPYGRTLEGARAEIDAQVPHRNKRKWILGTLLASRPLMRLVGSGTRIAQALRLPRMAPRRYRRLAGGMRPLSGRGSSVLGHETQTAPGETIALLAGCVQDEWFRPVNRAAVELLERAGHKVVVPKGQTCCGALAAHDGKADAAEQLEARNREVFHGFGTVTATVAGCSAHLAGYEWKELGLEVVDITVAVARAISDGRLPTLPPNGRTVAIQDPCHLRHAQGVVDEPRLLLTAAGYEVAETDPVGLCCGAAGLYTVLQPEASERLGRQKADQVTATGTELVASANPGCEMQLRSYLTDRHRIKHPIEWYLEALDTSDETADRPVIVAP